MEMFRFAWKIQAEMKSENISHVVMQIEFLLHVAQDFEWIHVFDVSIACVAAT